MKHARLLVSLFVCSVLVGLLVPRMATASNVNFANIWVGKITPGSGQVGVDIWWPTSSGDYNPCQHSNDIFYGACVMSNVGQVSYYKVMGYTPSGTNFPSGIFIDNTNPNSCMTASWCTHKTDSSITHGWANLISNAALEIYPFGANGKYSPYTQDTGGVRIYVNGFPLLANGGRYSANIGNITMPTLGQPGIGKLNGFVTDHGVNVAANRINIDAFQNDISLHSSTGYELAGFASFPNIDGGYYSTGALPNGSYKIYLTDNQTGHKVILDQVAIHLNGERLDFKLDQRCFGFPGPNCIDPAH